MNKNVTWSVDYGDWHHATVGRKCACAFPVLTWFEWSVQDLDKDGENDPFCLASGDAKTLEEAKERAEEVLLQEPV
jgi:hypothetical protein